MNNKSNIQAALEAVGEGRPKGTTHIKEEPEEGRRTESDNKGLKGNNHDYQCRGARVYRKTRLGSVHVDEDGSSERKRPGNVPEGFKSESY